MSSDDEAPARARRAQVLAAAADVFARTAITPEALSEIARMSKEQIIEELIAHNMEQTFTVLREAQAAPGPVLECLMDAVPAGVERNLDPEPGAVQLELMAEAVRNPKVAGMWIRALMNPALKRDALIAAESPSGGASVPERPRIPDAGGMLRDIRPHGLPDGRAPFVEAYRPRYSGPRPYWENDPLFTAAPR